MLHLALIFHMHQPYYKNLLTNVTDVPWVRFHGTKDYLDMVQKAENFPGLRLTFNLVPSLMEQIEDYNNNLVKDKFLELSYKPVAKLSDEEKWFIRENFFMINKDSVISRHPRYYELFFKKQTGKDFADQDILDLQVWFNLAWIDPLFRENIPVLNRVVKKARFFTEKDKQTVLDAQLDILRQILPEYKKMVTNGHIEVTVSPYCHPILPLLYKTTIAKEANRRVSLPNIEFSYPADAKAQIKEAIRLYKSIFGDIPTGMWPSEEAVSEHVVPLFIQSGIKWIVADEAILFKSLKSKKRDTKILYQPHLLKRKDGEVAIVFRDRNLSDLIGFSYFNWRAEDAVNNFMGHLENISKAFKGDDTLVTVAMDGENAWEYFSNDGHDFLDLLYRRLSESTFVKTVTLKEYLETHRPKHDIKRLAAGSWIYAEFAKWIGNPYKNKAWEYLTEARRVLEECKHSIPNPELAFKQMYIAEGSDWFWWYGDNQADFDRLFRMHLSNLYTLMQKPVPEYLKYPLNP